MLYSILGAPALLSHYMLSCLALQSKARAGHSSAVTCVARTTSLALYGRVGQSRASCVADGNSFSSFKLLSSTTTTTTTIIIIITYLCYKYEHSRTVWTGRLASTYYYYRRNPSLPP
ncbi:hypothetical protein L227DRAFT_176227 [Lentinus tigrinus ALCF2SS1-6]|uniref:Secreted protein n=1 Tax=Lentinus tigrinus ALCF2SS1-6 TaxID=1328759 RepID=A0A5C2S4W8_9APHY|nr:hypothetical protein L227DRAFT_176227 [Lentinus tigrinus ALCF2SS1-6]